ncbi:MAG TPA: hypothetical protein VGM56_08520, partial [Byssovorax sp.]
ANAFFARAFAKEPAHRFHSAADMAAALRELATRATGAPRRDAPLAFGPTAVAPSNAPPAAAPPPPFAPTPAAAPAPVPLPAPAAPRAASGVGAGVWLLVGGGALMLLLLAIGFGLFAASGELSKRTDPAGPPSPAPTSPAVASATDDALCESECHEYERCVGVGAPGCFAECKTNGKLRACFGRRPRDCAALATCALGRTCDVDAAAGRSTCKQAADCEYQCAARGGDVRPCMCGCAHRVAPERALTLASVNTCVATQCASECAAPLRGAVCTVCVLSRCKTQNDACQTR